MSGLVRPKVIVLGAVIKENKILLIKRTGKVFNGMWGLVGGKLETNETIKEGIIREVKEETSVDCEFLKTNYVLQVYVKEFNKSYIAFFSTFKANSQTFVESDEGPLNWFDINKLPKNIVKADKWLIENCLDKELNTTFFKYD